MVAAANKSNFGSEHYLKILVDDATYQSSKTHFVYDVRPPIQVKGKSHLIPIYSPIDPEDVCLPPPKENDHVIVGRENELKILKKVVDAMVDQSKKKSLLLMHGMPQQTFLHHDNNISCCRLCWMWQDCLVE